MGINKAMVVGVLKGGLSPERPISLKSGAAVARGLRDRGWSVVEIDVGPDLPSQLLAAGVQVAWLALHGPLGEDGCVQGLLEVMRIPYTGSGVKGSAIAMDKHATKRMLAGTGVPMAGDRTWRKGEPFPEGLRFPVMVKTPEGGSTLGIRKCHDASELEAGLLYCLEFADTVLIEDFIEGQEYTAAVLDGRALPVVAIRPENEFFDFEAKYTKGKTNYICPAPIPDELARQMQAHAVTAWRVLGLAGVVRADFIVDADGQPWFLEINTLPGMTETSLSPMAAGALGVSFGELVEHVLLQASLKVLPAVKTAS